VRILLAVPESGDYKSLVEMQDDRGHLARKLQQLVGLPLVTRGLRLVLRPRFRAGLVPRNFFLTSRNLASTFRSKGVGQQCKRQRGHEIDRGTKLRLIACV
jgi:hypothetical protein